MSNLNESSSTAARTQLRQQREDLKAKYTEFFNKVSALMFEHDPIGINFEDNSDEYEPEAGTVIPRIQSCSSASELNDVIHEEFIRWFGPETAGPRSSYETLALAIWSLALVSDWPTSKSAA